MEQQLSEVTQVKETYDPDQVNELLKKGWVLQAMFPSPNKTFYVLVKF